MNSARPVRRSFSAHVLDRLHHGEPHRQSGLESAAQEFVMNLIKKASIATALAATALVSASPAMARHNRGDDTAAIAIGAGIIGLALGAIVASSNNDRHDRDWQYRRGWEYRDGYYWDRQGRRYDRNGRRFYNDDYHVRRGYRADRDFYRGY
jgi:hypothetical protein